MRSISLLDTSVASDNLGDEIIMNAVRHEIGDIFADRYAYTVPTHDTIGRYGRKILRRSDLAIAGGTNLMSSGLFRNKNWKISPLDVGAMRNVVLMGVGWMDYHPRPSRYARMLYGRILSPTHIHSFRDSYSLSMMERLGLRAVNTGCPTMWRLTPDRCAAIPTQKAPDVVVALTFYRPEPAADRALLKTLSEKYRRVFFWPQQFEDVAYARSLGDFDLIRIDPNVAAYGALLSSEDVDFVGSRLHGGIHALHHGKRSLILTIDNRAREIAKDTGLPVVERDDIEAIGRWIDTPAPTRLDLPVAAIARWKAQFDRVDA